MTTAQQFPADAEPAPALTAWEIQEVTINPGAAREAFRHVTLRLQDALQAKSDYDQKLAALFGGYVAICLGLMTGAAVAATDAAFRWMVPHLFIEGMMFALGALCFALALGGMEYGSAGSGPETWIRSGIIDGDDAAVDKLLALIVLSHDGRIQSSVKSNKQKARAITTGIVIALCAMLYVFVVAGAVFSVFV